MTEEKAGIPEERAGIPGVGHRIPEHRTIIIPEHRTRIPGVRIKLASPADISRQLRQFLT